MSIKSNKNITRKEALKKMGRYAALTSLGTFMILNPKKRKRNLTQEITRLIKSKNCYKTITQLFLVGFFCK